jgi:hypothetical protein
MYFTQQKSPTKLCRAFGDYDMRLFNLILSEIIATNSEFVGFPLWD